ncbi:ABC transporter permease [Clostridium sp. D2Q-14]|uniref:ABC transporter permease n=1 Tax=Anaeromonas gelatinilytica TaxID=2683194 RepID=UPI00193B9EA6|nr:ABC transporter permease [Anaeromonas gelatinilytica]MBS4534102.1 ABC transporter permease [Anaeromonas gelatinilytica]
MKDFFTVLKFELMGFLKNKTFLISTIIICVLLIVGLSIPTIKDTFFDSEKDTGEDSVDSDDIYGYINRDESLINIKDLEESFFVGKLVEYENQEKLEKDINSGEIEAGYIIETPTKYRYIIKNNEMLDSNRTFFEEALMRAYRMSGFKQLGIEYSEVEGLISPNMEYDTDILGKDSSSNYLYTYILVFVLYFMIIIYGQLVATSVASEKSNRTMEVLVTSTDSSNLIFGKVIGGALAGIIQVGLVILISMTTYNLNADAWDNKLDFVFKIPSEVLLTFSIFGILGYLFYTFIFGTLGALVSRTEDVSSSSTPITIIFIGVFGAAMMGMYNTESMVLKVTSFIPFSSFMSMFVRVSMGTVSTIEIIISLVILTVSTVLIGILASKIYRMATLMYGNPIKLKNAFKLIRKK